MSLEMFATSDIASAICSSCDKNEKLRLQALLLVKNGLSPAKVAGDFSVHRSNSTSLDEASRRRKFVQP